MKKRMIVAAMAIGLVAGNAFSAEATWDGDHASFLAWTAGVNWVGDVVPTFNNETDLIFGLSGNSSTFSYLGGGGKVVNTMTFNNNLDSLASFSVSPNNGGGTKRNIFFAGADAGVTHNTTTDVTIGSGKGSQFGITYINTNVTLDVQSTGKLIMDKTVAGAGNLTKNGSGTLRITANNASHTGEFIINAGTVEVVHAQSLGKNSNILTMNGGILDLTANNMTANGKLKMNGGEISSTAGKTVFANNGIDAQAGTFSSRVGFNSAGSLTKTTDGILTISSTGAYEGGNSTISDGTLVVDGKMGNGLNLVTVADGAILMGSGIIEDAVSMEGFLNPGNSPGTLTFNNDLTLESSATLTLELSGIGVGEFDILANDGEDTLTLGGILALDDTGYTATLGDSFVVFENWDSIAGSFDSITGTDLGGGLSFELSGDTITVIPEPAALGMIAIMGGGLLGVRRIFMI